MQLQSVQATASFATLNAFSWFDIVAAVLAGLLILVSLRRAVRLTRQTKDILFTIIVFLVFVFESLQVYADNSVPAGTPAVEVLDGPENALLYTRLTFTPAAKTA